MTRTQKALYFAFVCSGIVLVGLLLLAYGYRVAHAAGPTQGTWSIDGSGNITAISTATDTAKYFMGNSLNPNGGSFPVCSGGESGTGAINSTSFIGFNVFSTGGVNTSGMGIDCRPAGDYYFVLTHSPYTTSDVSTYYVLHWDGSNVTPVNPATPTTYIRLTQPTQGTTTATTTLNLSADYNIGSDISSFSLNGSLPNAIGVQFFIQNVATNQQIFIGPDFSIASTSGQYSYSTTTVLAQGDYTVVAQLIGDYGSSPPPAGCEPLPPFVTCTTTENLNTIAQSAPPVTFSLNNGTFPLLGFQVGSSTSRNGLATTTCDVLHVGGCFQNALTFLFYPSPGALDSFGNLWQTVKDKPPFGYVGTTISALQTLNASSTPAFSFSDLPLTTEIFTPIRTGIAALLWLGFIIVFYRERLRNLDI